MERVLGIGGVFFKSRDPKKLARWYRDNLGVPIDEDQSYGTFTAGTSGDIEQMVWSLFEEGSDYFGDGDARVMINYRVANLDAMLQQLRDAGARVDDKVEDYGYGRFGWAWDPEGNRFELWQPAGPGF